MISGIKDSGYPGGVRWGGGGGGPLGNLIQSANGDKCTLCIFCYTMHSSLCWCTLMAAEDFISTPSESRLLWFRLGGELLVEAPKIKFLGKLKVQVGFQVLPTSTCSSECPHSGSGLLFRCFKFTNSDSTSVSESCIAASAVWSG
jgi:hypothetical protein